MSLLPQFLAFASTLALMLLLSRWINRQVQVIGLRLSGDMNVAVMVYYLLMFPGIVLHELSHYLMARLLGMQVGRFALGPKKRRNAIELGSVTVSSGGTLRDSLVGLAPFLAGTAVLLLISYYVFDVAALGEAWRTAGWAGVWDELGGIWHVADFWLWAYVIFVVSNSMTPSEADRQPWVLAGIYLGIALLVVWLFGGFAALSGAFLDEVTGDAAGADAGISVHAGGECRHRGLPVADGARGDRGARVSEFKLAEDARSDYPSSASLRYPWLPNERGAKQKAPTPAPSTLA